MAEYSSAISQITNAQSLDAIKQIVGQYSAQAAGPGGILYSGNVGLASAHDLAIDLVTANAQNGVAINIIDNTPRGLLLTDDVVRTAISETAQSIFQAQGMSANEAAAAANRFIFGSADVASGQIGSLSSSLRGEASNAFTRSLSGDITIIGTVQQANPLKIFAQVEIPALLENPNVTSAGGVAISDLKAAGVNAFDLCWASLPMLQKADSMPRRMEQLSRYQNKLLRAWALAERRPQPARSSQHRG
jgi:hypothetical protein